MSGQRQQLLLIALGAAGALYLYQRSRPADAPSIIASVVETVTETAQDFLTGQTRGERNNNPGNIRQGQAWQGLAPFQYSPFAVFVSPVYGIRALAKTLLTYQSAYGLNTIAGLITRWAPPAENDTAAYIAAVSRDCGMSPTLAISVSNPEILNCLTRGIIHQENGRVSYDAGTIATGINAALTS